MARPMTAKAGGVPAGRRTHQPLLGLRRRPGRIALAFMRLPLAAYRHDAGWLFGSTFMRFTHLGRKTGTPHDTVAMVLGFDRATREVVICAGWGPRTDWYRNLRAGPATEVEIGRDIFTPRHRFLDDAEAFAAIQDFRARHPHRVRFISSVLGWGDLRDDARVRAFVRDHPFVAFRPAPAGSS